MAPETKGWRVQGFRQPLSFPIGASPRILAGGAERGAPTSQSAYRRGCHAEATRCNRAGDTAWVPGLPVAPGMQRVPSAGRTAGSAGPRRRNAQLRWAMRGQDPLKEQRVPGSAGLLGGRTPEPQATELSLLAYAHQQPLVLARREHHVEPDNQHGEVDSIEPDGPGQVVRGKPPGGDDRAHAFEDVRGRIEPRDRLEPVRQDAQRVEDAGDR